MNVYAIQQRKDPIYTAMGSEFHGQVWLDWIIEWNLFVSLLIGR